MCPDYAALRGETDGLPPDGVHDAYLDAARLVDTRNGEAVVADWRTVGEPLYQWTSWHRLHGQGLAFTLAFFDDLGIDRSGLGELDGQQRLEDALEAHLGEVFAVRTSRWGSNGGGGVNVEIEGKATQTTLDVDAPIDTTGLPSRPAPPTAEAADVKLPF